METTKTTFGTVERDEYGTTLRASGDVLADWAHRGDCRWPCSELANLEWIQVEFDMRGDLVDIASNLRDCELSADELNAWTSETLQRAGYPNHPAIRDC